MPPPLRAAPAAQDPLVASEEELVRAACERHHPGLNRAFVEAGTPWSNVRLLCMMCPSGRGAVLRGSCCACSESLVAARGGKLARPGQTCVAGRQSGRLLCVATVVTAAYLRCLLPQGAAPFSPADPAYVLGSASHPCLQGSIASNPEGIRKALRSKGHERLMRVVHLLTSKCEVFKPSAAAAAAAGCCCCCAAATAAAAAAGCCCCCWCCCC